MVASRRQSSAELDLLLDQVPGLTKVEGAPVFHCPFTALSLSVAAFHCPFIVFRRLSPRFCCRLAGHDRVGLLVVLHP